jgi:hypothetical protein
VGFLVLTISFLLLLLLQPVCVEASSPHQNTLKYNFKTKKNGYVGSLFFRSLVAVCLSNGKIIVIHLTKVAVGFTGL